MEWLGVESGRRRNDTVGRNRFGQSKYTCQTVTLTQWFVRCWCLDSLSTGNERLVAPGRLVLLMGGGQVDSEGAHRTLAMLPVTPKSPVAPQH